MDVHTVGLAYNDIHERCVLRQTAELIHRQVLVNRYD